jgi:hypothetical protein
VNWTASTDANSGLAHYWGVWNTTPVFDPVAGTNIAAGATSNTTNIGSSTSARYFHLRALDNAGNLGLTRHFGPIYANSASVSIYCTAKTNSLGCVPAIGSSGTPSATLASPFLVSAAQVRNQKLGLLFYGFAPAATPFLGGLRCIGGPSIRTPVQSSGGNALPADDCSGAHAFDFNARIQSGVDPLLVAGEDVYCQWWTRDPGSAANIGLTDALEIRIQP